MPYKDKEKHKAYYKKYYHTHNLKEKQSARARLNYWRKKYMEKFNVTLEECKNFTESELRQWINSKLIRVDTLAESEI